MHFPKLKPKYMVTRGYLYLICMVVMIKFLPVDLTSAQAETVHESQLGVQVGQATISASGYFVGKIPIVPITRFFLLRDLSDSFSLNLYSDTSSNIYMNTGAGVRYFPFSVSSHRRLRGKSYLLEYSDTFKSFIGGGISLGRVRLETKDEIGATEISANFYGPELSLGINIELLYQWNFDLSLSYSVLSARSDSTVAFTGNGLSMLLGGSRAF